MKTIQLVLVMTLLLAALASASETKEATPVKLLIFREDCYDSFFNRFDFTSDPTCIKFTFSKLIGYLIITGATILKVPQIMKILKAGSCQGVSASAYYFELLVYANTLGYSRHLQLPFSVYGETFIILAQNAVVLALIFHYDKTIGMGEKLAFSALFSTYLTVLLLDTPVPEHVWPFVSSSCMMFNGLSRIPVIYQNFSAKNTGQLAFVTFFLAWAGSLARLATVFIESDDFLYKAQFTASTAFNTCIVLQFALYWNNAPAGKGEKESKVEMKDLKKEKKPDTKKTQ